MTFTDDLRRRVEKRHVTLGQTHEDDAHIVELDVLVRDLWAEVERLQAQAQEAAWELDDIADYAGGVKARIRSVAQNLRAVSPTPTEGP